MAKNKYFNRGAVNMSNKRIETLSAMRILLVIVFSVLATMIMVHLNAYEKLHQFVSAYSIPGFREFIIFTPAFFAMGLALYAVKQIEELEAEVRKRRATEDALIESEKRFRNLSITDELTGLYNVRYFYNKLDVEIERANRYSTPLSIVFVDINDFKNYNDKYGHLEGDHVLRRIAQTIQSCMRVPDSTYRYGGDEFVGILPEAREPAATVVAERIIELVKDLTFSPDSDKAVSMMVSVGVAEYTPPEEREAFVKRADMNMYVCKNKQKGVAS